ncbi:MAG TPA: spore coat associated protein CotJA [Candidatus Bariatricus faecipullorum]|nr:spore coat associated protein CotJA [Candidatus Bariatricus faecipullorum]
MPLAMAYVPWQNWRNLYDIHKGFTRGTIFEELDKPFYGKGGCNR